MDIGDLVVEHKNKYRVVTLDQIAKGDDRVFYKIVGFIGMSGRPLVVPYQFQRIRNDGE